MDRHSLTSACKMGKAGEMRPRSQKLDHHLSRNARSNYVMDNDYTSLKVYNECQPFRSAL